jgi:hypothetical protein
MATLAEKIIKDLQETNRLIRQLINNQKVKG